MRNLGVFSLIGLLGVSVAVASPEGSMVFVDASMDTLDIDTAAVVDSLNPFEASAHILVGPSTLLTAKVPFVTDVLVSSWVSTVGNMRTVHFDYASVTGGEIFQPGHADDLELGGLYRVGFWILLLLDFERFGPANYSWALRDVDGNDHLGGLVIDFALFPAALVFTDEHDPATPDFYGIRMNGRSMTITYMLIPSPTSAALFGLAGALASQRRRSR